MYYAVVYYKYKIHLFIMIQFSLYKLELPLNYHDRVLQLSHTKIIKNIVSCILQFLIYYYYINNIKMLTFLLKTKLLLD